MAKKNFINIVDFGNANLRFSVFDTELKQKFSETISFATENGYNADYNNLIKKIKKAEKKIGTHVQDIILLLDTKELFLIDISISKYLDNKISISKIYNLLILEINSLINNHYNNQDIIHIILDQCIINEKVYNFLPKDLENINVIKVSFKIICYPKILINEIRNNFIKNNLNIKKIFCTTYVKTLNYLNKFKRNRISFLEIGCERSSLIIYQDKKLQFFQSIPIGSFHITKDISKIFGINFKSAENIKQSFNKTETEFSYENKLDQKHLPVKDILNKNISVDKLKKVILYRVQEIIDLIFERANKQSVSFDFNKLDLFLIGGGSMLLNNNSFYLNDKYQFNSINYYGETDSDICNSGLIYYINNYEIPKLNKKKLGLFGKFFNLFEG